MFPDLEYIRWIEGRPSSATHDLGSSDLDPWVGNGGPATATDLAAPETDRSLSALLADRHDVPEEWVLPTAGATHANVLAVVAALDRTEQNVDRVVVEKPGYEPLRETPRLFGATVDRFIRPPEDDAALDPDRVEGAITDETALVTVTNRHNPSGRLSDRQTLSAAAERTVAADLPLLVDEVYGPFTDDDGSGPFGGVSAAGLDGAVVSGSLTKFHGLGPLQLGWLIGDPEFLAHARKAARHLPGPSAPSRRLGRRVLAAPDAVEPRAREQVRTNHDRLAAFVAERADLSGTVHEGSTYAFLAHERADGDAVAAAAWEDDVLVVPGRFFEDDSSFRVSVAGGEADVRAALSALGDVLDRV